MIEEEKSLTTRRILRTWWPLATSWILMALEGPAMNIVVARLADPKIHLAAYGSLVFPLALFIEAPIIMLLAASTALCRDGQAYRKIGRFTHTTSFLLTGVHAIVAFTPLYDLLVRHALHAPPEIVGPARIGLIVMLPWTWAIAYRRFNQGVLIRFGHSLAVGIGTIVRLLCNGAVLLTGFLLAGVPGTTVAACAAVVGVVGEAIYVSRRVRPVLRNELARAPLAAAPLTHRAFLRFYVPLSSTSIILLGVRPILTAGISRMPAALDSLAVLPVITGLTFLFRSVGLAYGEVVIAHLGAPGSTAPLRRFTVALMGAGTLGLLLISATPLSRVWFGTITGLTGHLIDFARSGLLFAVLLPALATAQSWYQGILIHSERTRGVTESMLIYLAATASVLWAGVHWGRYSGIYVALVAMTIGELLRNAWLWRRSRRERRPGDAKGAARSS
jgi:hypothetical protein